MPPRNLPLEEAWQLINHNVVDVFHEVGSAAQNEFKLIVGRAAAYGGGVLSVLIKAWNRHGVLESCAELSRNTKRQSG